MGISHATTARYAQNYVDTSPEFDVRVNDDTFGDMQNLRVTYNMSEGICLIRGVNFSYLSVGAGPHSVDLQFEGDIFSANYSDTGIPYAGSDLWRVFYCNGPIYLLDDAPAVNFIGTQSSSNCIQIGGDTGNSGNSFFDTGGGWMVDTIEYIVDLIYEWVLLLNISESVSGSITVSDNIDAYFVNLTAGVPYMFVLDRTSGTGNLNMRLVANQELTNNVLASSSGTLDPEYLAYTPSSNGTYVLLVEAETAGIDVADYNITYMVDNPPTSNQPGPVVTTSTGTETVDWMLFDDFGSSYYRVLVNSTPSTWNTWINNTNLLYPINRTAPGIYNYTIEFNDTGNNWGLPDSVAVTILDSPPTSDSPDDITTPVNGSVTIPWILTDDYGAGYYRVFVNLSPSAWQPWVNNTPVNYPINTTIGGTFDYVIQFNDSVGNLGTTDLVIVIVQPDSTPPTSTSPNNITTTRSGTETIDWVLTDNVASGYYRVVVNSTPSNWNTWTNNTNLQYPINRTIPGIFNYTIEFNDSAGISGTPDTVFVTILDNPPTSNQPSNIITSTTSTASIPWNMTDDYGAGFYRVLVNASPDIWQTWTNNTNLNHPVNTTIAGIFNYTIQYNDSAGQWGVPHTVTVTVLLDAPPISNQPANITTYVGYTETIGWTLTDDAGAGYYRVLIDDTPGTWANWTNNTALDYPVNTTITGTFNYTLQFNDSAGQFGVPNTVIVTVDIDDPPQSNQPSAITTYVGYTESIGWILTDDVGTGYYRVLINGSPGAWNTWTNNSAINYPVNTTVTGTFNYTIQYNDSIGQLGTPHVVTVNISIDYPPTITNPDDIVTIVDYVVYIGWIISDPIGSGYYRVLYNDSPGLWNAWMSGIPINHPINTSSIGIFNYTIQYNDSSGQWGTPDSVLVIVNEPPPFPTGQTQINLTCTINGTLAADQTGFSIPVQGWNATYVDMTVSNVSLYDYLYAVEEDTGGAGFRYRIDSEIWVMGFNITDTCLLDTVDFIYSTYEFPFPGGDTAYTNVFIYNATYSAINERIEPDQVIYNQTELGLEALWNIIGTAFDWISASSAGYWDGNLTVKPILNITETYQNSFFIGFSSNSTFNWYLMYDSADPEGDQGPVYRQGFAEAWYNSTTPEDLTLRLNLIPLRSVVKPSEINMAINAKPVTDLGTWNFTGLLIPEPSGDLPFTISSAWYNISLQVNWTTHLLEIGSAVTSYLAEPLNPIIPWNVTVAAVFATASYDKRINVTIPVTWNTTNVYYNSVEHSNDSWQEITGSKFVIISDADNGMWVVTCEGLNWISNLTLSKTVVYTFDTVNITARLINPAYDGENDNAQVFVTDPNQQMLDDTLTGKATGNFINITWNVAQSIHADGYYQVIVSWFNGTEAGMWNTSVRVYNSTSIEIVAPEHRGMIIEMAKGQVFNLTIYYNMSYWLGSSWGTLYLNKTMGANVTYTFLGSAPQPMLNTSIGGNWAWTTTITSPITHGTYAIYINATSWSNVQNYTNYLITLNVKQFGTQLIFNDTAKEVFWDQPIAFSFTYTNLTGYSIVTDNITIDWKYDGDVSYRGMLQEGVNYSKTYNAGTEVYTIVFDNLTAHTFKLLFHIDADAYESQDAYLTLQFNNRTTSLTNQTSIPRAVYQENGIINITVYYEDLVDNVGIPGGIIQSNWSNVKDYTVQDIGGGYYVVSLNISSVALNNYSILISAMKANYEPANIVVLLEIYGYPTNITSLYAANLTGYYAIIYAMENWTVSFEYVNASNGVGIAGAVISASLGGQSCAWQNGVGGNYTVWADASKLASPMSGQNFTLQIVIGKAFYEMQSITITVNITELPTLLYPTESVINAEIDDFVEISVWLNDTYNIQGVSGMVWYEIQGVPQQMMPTATPGLYSATLNLTDYLPSIYQINLSSWAVDYQNATETIILNVSRLSVTIIADSTITGYVDDLLNISIQLKDSKNRIIENLAVSYEIPPGTMNGSFVYDANGFYNATIDLTSISDGSYQLRINSSLTMKYYDAIVNLNLEVYKIPTIIIASNMNITAYFEELYLLSVNYFNTHNSSFIDGADLRYEIVGEVPLTSLIGVGLGTYQATLNSTAIGIGDYIINVTIGSPSSIYQDANLTIDLHIRARIQAELTIYLPTEIGVGEILDITFELQTNNSIPIANEVISYSIITQYHNASPTTVEQAFVTNQSGMGVVQYMVPTGAKLIDIIGSFAGTTNLTAVSNAASITVKITTYYLVVRVQTHIQVGEELLIQADLSNETHPIANAYVNFTILVVISEEVADSAYIGGYTNANGTVSVNYRVPEGTISLYIIASYTGVEGAVTNSNPQIVVALDAWLLWLQQWGSLIGLIALILVVVIIGLATYFKYIKRRFMSIKAKKRSLIQKRAETRREITVITQEIQNIRTETLKEADLANKNMEYAKSAKLYEKAGNLTLELSADKMVAREFFGKAKEMQKLADQKSTQKDLRAQREKFLDKARSAIRERSIAEASRNYRQVAEISRILGEKEQATKFLKLADAAHERIEALKEGDLRKKSGVYLSKADKAMGKQNFLEAAENFEEAAKIMLLLGDDEAVQRFTGWAKLARERELLTTQETQEEWEEGMVKKQKGLIQKAKGLVRERNFEEAANVYSLLTIYALELGSLASVKKFKKDIDFCRKQASAKEVSPEIRSLMNERKKLLANVEEAVRNNRYAVAARYYKRIATISETIDGKEVARTYTRQANYYLDKMREKKRPEKVVPERRKLEKRPVEPVEKVEDDKLEETKVELARTVKNAREALKTGKTVLARELYEKSSILAAMVGDKESEMRYRQKAEDLEVLKPKKVFANEAVVRKKISELMKDAEKAMKKKKYQEAKNNYEEISELFIQLGEDDAASEFLERANSIRRLI